MANSKFVRLYYSEITDTNDLVFWNTKLNIENDEEMLDEIYKAFNVFIDTVDAHQNDLIPYFNKLCVNTVARALYYNEDTSFTDLHVLISTTSHSLFLMNGVRTMKSILTNYYFNRLIGQRKEIIKCQNAKP